MAYPYRAFIKHLCQNIATDLRAEQTTRGRRLGPLAPPMRWTRGRLRDLLAPPMRWIRVLRRGQQAVHYIDLPVQLLLLERWGVPWLKKDQPARSVSNWVHCLFQIQIVSLIIIYISINLYIYDWFPLSLYIVICHLIWVICIFKF